ncbi:MAG: hypothetical protein LLF96_11735 [Eubacteriales bacterium]|nr:hypothetical protein [Eubacteriales bacterium]
MIYDTNFIRKEFRNAYMQQQVSRKRQFFLGIFLGLLTFAIYFSLQTLKESVINDVAPFLLLSSYFSTLYIYLFLSLMFNIIYYISNYEYMTFIEVMHNRWYTLVQLGYPPLKLVGSKIIARIISQAAIYSIGYIATIFISSFLKFPLVLDYLLTMYLMGLIDIVLLAMVSLTASLYMRDLLNARYLVGMLGIMLVAFKFLSNYYSILENRSLMVNVRNMFDWSQSFYMYIAMACILFCVVICLVRGRQLAQLFNPPMLQTLPLLTQKPSGTVVLISADADRKNIRSLEAQSTPTRYAKKWSIATVVTSILIITLIASMLLINVAVLAFGYASPEKETSIYGIVPYVFQSSTMEPAIMNNDIAFFRKLDSQATLSVGDVLLFKDMSGQVDVASLVAFTTDEVTGELTGQMKVDILNYIDERYRGVAAQVIDRSQVYGVHVSNNRWFGAIVLFANTTLGRLVLLLIPTFLIFFYDPIIKMFRNLTEEKA